MNFKVAIVGRPNVGKSSLFNRICGYRKSVIDDVAGSTRDRIYETASWNNFEFKMIDTGGIEFLNSSLLVSIKKQVDIAIDEADLIIFLTDVKNGVTKEDNLIANQLKKANKPVILVCNKMDDIVYLADTYEFYKLGLGDPIGVSCNHGIGIGDLLDKIVSYINKDNIDISNNKNDNEIRVSIIGKPNVGKSSLLNAILDKDRTIVSDIAGTTRDAIDEEIIFNDKKYIFTDTAGIRKASKINLANEKYSVIRSLDALTRSDVGMLVLDYNDINILDKNVAQNIDEMNKAVVLCINKLDLAQKSNNYMSDFTKKMREEFKFFSYAQIVYISALKKQRINTIFDAINKAYTSYTKEIQTSILNNILLDITTKNPPQPFNGNKATFSYITQKSTKPPTFIVFVNDPKYIHFTYVRYLENEFRKQIDFEGSPIKFEFRSKKS